MRLEAGRRRTGRRVKLLLMEEMNHKSMERLRTVSK